MRLRNIRPNLPFVALTGVLLLSTVLATTFFTGLSHQFISKKGYPLENLFWQLTQVQLEYERTYRMSVEALAEPTDARLTAALRRYEVFASRVPVVLQGDGMARISLYPDLVQNLNKFSALIVEIDAATAAASDHKAKVDAIVARLAGSTALVLDYAVAAKDTLNTEEDVHTDSEHTLQSRLILLFYGVVAVVLVFAILAWMQLRRVDRSRRRLAKLAKRLVSESQRAEAASRAKTDFLANMSHELRTPLNAIIGFAEMVGGETFGRITQPKYVEYVRNIQQSGQYMLTLVGDLLDIARIEAGRLRMKPEWLDLFEECTHAIESLDAKAREQGVTFEMTGVPRDLFVHADSHAFRHMLAAVLSNAVRYNNPGGICVIHIGDEADWFRLSVTDTGKGMAPKLVERLLDPFTHIAEKTVEGMQETGFGLSLVRRYMELHGGRIRIASIEHGGTTVSLLFPVKCMHRADIPHAAD